MHLGALLGLTEKIQPRGEQKGRQTLNAPSRSRNLEALSRNDPWKGRSGAPFAFYSWRIAGRRTRKGRLNGYYRDRFDRFYWRQFADRRICVYYSSPIGESDRPAPYATTLKLFSHRFILTRAEAGAVRQVRAVSHRLLCAAFSNGSKCLTPEIGKEFALQGDVIAEHISWRNERRG